MGGFGKSGKIPWNVPEDMKHFKEVTSNHVCVMGRKTYADMLKMYQDRLGDSFESTLGDSLFQILPNRDSYVVSRNSELEAIGAKRVNSPSEVFDKFVKTNRKIFVLGGYQLFVAALNEGAKVYMTIIKGDNYSCDVKFPIKILDNYKIVNGRETKDCYFIEYEHK